MAERALATAFVNIVPGTKDLDSYLKGKLGDDMEDAGKTGGARLGSGMLGAFKGFAATLGVTLGAYVVVDFVKQSVTAASDLNEAFTAVNAVFGSASGEIDKWASGAATALGQSKLQALDAAKTFGIYGQAAGMSAKENAKFAMSLTGLATDFASFYNASPQEAIEAIGAALRGENEPIRRFGVLLDDATLRATALKMGLIQTTKEALTPQTKVMAAYQAILEQTGTAQGDFARTSEGLANQQRIAAAQMTNFKASLGEALLPAAVAVTSFLNTDFIPALNGVVAGAKELGGWIQSNATWLGPLAAAVVAGAIAFKVYSTAVGIAQAVQVGYAAASYGATAATYAVGAAQKIGAMWYAIMNSAVVTNTAALFANQSLTTSTKIAILASTVATQAATAAQWLWNAALSANPIGIVVVAIAALVAGLIWFFTQTDLGRQVWETLVGAISTGITWLWETILKPTFEAIGAIFQWLYQNIILPIVQGIVLYVIIWANIFTWLYENVVKPVFGFIGEMFKWIYENVIVPIIDKIVAYFRVWGAIFSWLYDNIVKPVFAALGAAFNWVWTNVIKPFIDWVSKGIEKFGQTFGEVFGGLASFARDAFNKVLDFVRPPINALIDLINGMIERLNGIKIDVPEFARDLFGGAAQVGFSIPKIPHLAKGGFVDRPTTALIGEAGPEVVTPLKDFERMMGLDGNGQTINYYAAPNESLDAEQALFTALKRAKVLGAW